MIFNKDHKQLKWLVIFGVFLGFCLRFLVSLRGHNYDFESYLIVAEIIERGGNVYAETVRYNYGPIWSYIIYSFYQLASYNVVIFRYLLISFLGLVDFGICVLLWHKFGAGVALFFFLNPITIIITGYHNQFDNLPVFLAMISALIIGNDFNKPITSRKGIGLIILGLSLITKHILFIFPLWLAIKQKGLHRKIIIIFIPISMFILSFLFYWNEGKQGIMSNVFLYRSHGNEIFYNIFVPNGIRTLVSSQMVWIILLVSFAIFFRHKNVFDSLLLYTCVVVAFSPATANQYLAIPVPFIATNFNPFALMYTTLGTFFLLINNDGLHISLFPFYSSIDKTVYYAILVTLLVLAFIWVVWYKQLKVHIRSKI
jgi:hypothetical protein